jgi:hypothetical protein
LRLGTYGEAWILFRLSIRANFVGSGVAITSLCGSSIASFDEPKDEVDQTTQQHVKASPLSEIGAIS